MSKILFACSLLFVIPCTAQLSFESQSFADAKENSTKSSKPFIAYFSANWCINCKIMEETTFRSEAVSMTVSEKYNLYKIDFDSPDAKDWTEKFKICCLPSFLIFDKEGQLLNKIEQPLTSSNFVKFLTNPSGYNPKEALHGNISLEQQPQMVAVSNISNEIKTTSNDKKLEPIKIIMRKRGEPIPKLDKTLDHKTTSAAIVDSKIDSFYNTGKAELHVPIKEVKPSIHPIYLLQIGYFSVKENASKLKRNAEKKFGEPVRILEVIEENNNTYYRVVIGNSNDLDTVKLLREDILKKGHKSIIRKVE